MRPRIRSPRSSRPNSCASCSCATDRTTPSTSIPKGTDQIPRLFDEFDKFAAATAGREVKGELPPGYEATFRYSLLDPDADVAAEAGAFRPAFGHLAMLIQLPGVDVVERVEAEKGSALTDPERALLDQRAGAARGWLETYAPESARLTVQHEAVPPAAAELDEDQRAFLANLADAAERDTPASGDAWQTLIFAVAAEHDVPGRRAFEAIYRAFLGRANGPRAGWLLASLDPVFVRDRAREASGWTAAGGSPGPLPVGG